MPVRTIEGMSDSAPLNEDAKAELSWGRNFLPRFGFSLPIDQETVVEGFLHTALSDIGSSKAYRLLAKPNVIAHLITCEGDYWEIRSEPIGEKEYGLTAYTDYGKAILAGTAIQNQSDGLSFNLSTLYPNITNAKKQSIECKGTVGQGKVEMSCSYKFEW